MAIDADKIIQAFQTDPAKALDDLREQIASGGRAALEKLKADPARWTFLTGNDKAIEAVGLAHHRNVALCSTSRPASRRV